MNNGTGIESSILKLATASPEEIEAARGAIARELEEIESRKAQLLVVDNFLRRLKGEQKAGPSKGLSHQQKQQVKTMIVAGESEEAIARELGLTLESVRKSVAHLKRQVQAHE